MSEHAWPCTATQPSRFPALPPPRGAALTPRRAPPPCCAAASLPQLWRAYFPNAAISFIELHEGTAEEFREEIEETGGNIFVGSQSDPDVMAQVRLLALATGGFDVIIDDGGAGAEGQGGNGEGAGREGRGGREGRECEPASQ